LKWQQIEFVKGNRTYEWILIEIISIQLSKVLIYHSKLNP